jgi:hypothetical protein
VPCDTNRIDVSAVQPKDRNAIFDAADMRSTAGASAFLIVHYKGVLVDDPRPSFIPFPDS